MQIDSTFSVVAPISQVWDTLMDFERVAGCLPGPHRVNKLSEDAYQVRRRRAGDQGRRDNGEHRLEDHVGLVGAVAP